MALDREQPNQLADEILLVIGGALHGLAYFIIEISGCRLLNSKWSILPVAVAFFGAQFAVVLASSALYGFWGYRLQPLKAAAKEHAICCWW